MKSTNSGRAVLRFDGFELDLEAMALRGRNGPIQVEPQVFELIALLAQNPGRLVGHDEIIAKVWRGRIVSDSAIATRIAAARKALGDDGAQQHIIKTIRGRGFRFELTALSDFAHRALPTTADAFAPYGTEREYFVLSCTPHAFSLIMKHRAGDPREDWRTALSSIFEATVVRFDGRLQTKLIAAFARAADAISAARALIEAADHHCKPLLAENRWTVKLGLAFGTLEHGFAQAVAGRLDAIAPPRGLCISKRALTGLRGEIDVEATAVSPADEVDDSTPFNVTHIEGLSLASAPRRTPHLVNLAIPEPEEPSILSIPWNVIGHDDELDQLAQGLRLEIHNAFARLSGCTTMAAGTQQAFAGASSPEAAASVGVRYVLQGSARAIDRCAKVMLELYDHKRGGVVWSQTYEGSLDDGFRFEDDVKRRVVRELDVHVLRGEEARIWHSKMRSSRGIQLHYKGLRDFFRMTRESNRCAMESFEELQSLHPELSTGANFLALCHWFDVQRGWVEDPTRSKALVKHWAAIAGSKEDCDGQGLTAACHVHLLDEEYDKAIAIGERAVAIRPSCGTANGFFAHSLYYCGELDAAVHHARLAIRFTPVHPSLFAGTLAGALHARDDHEAAIAIAKEAARINPNDGHAKLILCSALMAIGRDVEATAVGVELKRMEPDFRPIPFLNRLPFRHETMRQQLTLNCSRAILRAE